MSRNVGVESAGVITTPGVAFLARTGDFAAGIVISASHNPWRDNGIKVFGHDGYKLPDEVELEIEREIFAHLEENSSSEHGVDVRTLPGNPSLRESYIEWLVYSVTEDLSNLNALVDCANGAATPIAHEVLRRCGLGATFIHDVPDGRNINANCGALHPDIVAAAVRTCNSESALKRYALGMTFDGDADRALFSDDAGNII
jgi:phosphoglucosamine mutase